MIKDVCKNISNTFGDNILSLSGEVLITPQKDGQRDLLNQIDMHKVQNVLAQIKKQFNFMSIETVDGLLEINIKFFVYRARVSDTKFLDNFENYLSNLAKSILDTDDLFVRINAFGKFETKSQVLTYRYLNKKEEVKYTIANTIDKNWSSRMLTPRTYMLLIIIIMLSYVGYSSYNYYINIEKDQQSIQGLLHFIFGIKPNIT